MTCISCMLRTASCSLAKSTSHLVLTVITFLTLFECRLWILGLPPALLCSLDPRRPIKATQTRQSNKRGQAPDANQAQNNELPSPEEVLVTLRVQVDSCRPADLSGLTTILLGGTSAICSNRLLWTQAVKDHFDDVPLFVSCRKNHDKVSPGETFVFDVLPRAC